MKLKPLVKLIKYAAFDRKKDKLDLLTKQNNRCAICGEPAKEGHMLLVDHCHLSGYVRGLLCSRCNNLLGLAGDCTTEVLKNAINYLDSFYKQFNF